MENQALEKPKVYFKMTFSNSWWQCIVGLLFYWPFAIVFTLILGLIYDPLSGLGPVLGIFGCMYVAWGFSLFFPSSFNWRIVSSNGFEFTSVRGTTKERLSKRTVSRSTERAP